MSGHEAILADIRASHVPVLELYEEFIGKAEWHAMVSEALLLSYSAIVDSFTRCGTLFLCGNGGSMADALHISGEILKSFERDRRLSGSEQRKYTELRFGSEVADVLEQGFPAIVLGLNPSLSSAVQNDFSLPNMEFAQELNAMAREGDVLLGISTSGNARNVAYAMTVAAAKGLRTIGLTGESGGVLGDMADIVVRVPAIVTKNVQELHQPIYHALCTMVEAHFFEGKR
ncbi:SIS domain-containing protein [Candidatus Hydrogenedentota bacterium]